MLEDVKPARGHSAARRRAVQLKQIAQRFPQEREIVFAEASLCSKDRVDVAMREIQAVRDGVLAAQRSGAGLDVLLARKCLA